MKVAATILGLIPFAIKWLWGAMKSKAELEVVKEEKEVLKKELKRLRARLRKIDKTNNQ